MTKVHSTSNSSLAILGSAAVVVALALLVLQVVGGLEYTAGGSLYTRASMIAAMITLACLPVFIEAARHLSKGLVLALCVSFVSFLAYSLPATTGRTGEIKETNVVEQSKSIKDLERVQADHAETRRLVDESNRWQLQACKGGNGKDCKAATFVLNQRQASLEKLSKLLDDAKPVKAGDLGSDLWAWALGFLGVTAATVRKVSVLSFAIGLDVVIWSLIWFATAAFSTRANQLATTANLNASKEKSDGTHMAAIATDKAGIGYSSLDYRHLPDPASFTVIDDISLGQDDNPEPPKPPRKKAPRAKKKNPEQQLDKVVNFYDRYAERYGREPRFSTIKGVFGMSNGSAHRYLKAAKEKRASSV